MYVNYQLDKVSKTQTAEYIGQTQDGKVVFVKDFSGKKFPLKRSQVMKIYDPDTGKDVKV